MCLAQSEDDVSCVSGCTMRCMALISHTHTLASVFIFQVNLGWLIASLIPGDDWF